MLTVDVATAGQSAVEIIIIETKTCDIPILLRSVPKLKVKSIFLFKLNTTSGHTRLECNLISSLCYTI